MTWKDTVNTGLVRLTGYELARPVSGRRPTQTKSARPGRAGPGATTGPAAKSAKSAKSPALPKDYDTEAVATIAAVKPWTMTSPEKLNSLILAVRHVVRHQIPGDIVECGVWRGGSMQATARTLLE